QGVGCWSCRFLHCCFHELVEGGSWDWLWFDCGAFACFEVAGGYAPFALRFTGPDLDCGRVYALCAPSGDGGSADVEHSGYVGCGVVGGHWRRPSCWEGLGFAPLARLERVCSPKRQRLPKLVCSVLCGC